MHIGGIGGGRGFWRAAVGNKRRRSTSANDKIPTHRWTRLKMAAEVRWLLAISAIILAFANGYDGSTPHRRFEYKYSFKPPYLAQKDGSVPFWQYGGSEFLLRFPRAGRTAGPRSSCFAVTLQRRFLDIPDNVAYKFKISPPTCIIKDFSNYFIQT
jgi:Legume-like lectin family